MEKFIYSQHNTGAGFFNPIQVSDLEPENFAETLRRSIMLCNDPSKLSPLASCELVFIGSYDDKTMQFNLLEQPKVILDCAKIIDDKLVNVKH